MADIKNFAVNPTQKLLDQVEALGNCIAYKDSAIRIMADGHPGRGAVVGSCITYDDKIVPATVGVDIACTVSLFNLPQDIDMEKFDEAVHVAVPTGHRCHPIEPVESCDFPYEVLHCWSHFTSEQQNRIKLSMGTLGSGNHCLSIDESADGRRYMLVHCGSRSLGKLCCDYYQSIAESRMKDRQDDIRWDYKRVIKDLRDSGETRLIPQTLDEMNIEIDRYKDTEYAYLDGEDMRDYLHDMEIINRWVLRNHNSIYSNISSVYYNLTGVDFGPAEVLTCHHNYVDTEHRVIRKGAISAYDGEYGIIPLNMKDGTLIVRGIGDKDTLCSLPHGAGRAMSRSEARKSITLEEYQDAMKGVYSTTVLEGSIDEAPMAYKPAQDIIDAISGHCEIIEHLREVYNYKDC